jgi:large subunit ribosomal protein L24
MVAVAEKTQLRRGDTVRVIAGRDKGKTGKILAVAGGRVTVERVNIIKRHTRANPSKNVRGGILEKEASLHVSNVSIVCPGCGKHTRIGRNVQADGTRTRICRRCGTNLDQ